MKKLIVLLLCIVFSWFEVSSALGPNQFIEAGVDAIAVAQYEEYKPKLQAEIDRVNTHFINNESIDKEVKIGKLNRLLEKISTYETESNFKVLVLTRISNETKSWLNVIGPIIPESASSAAEIKSVFDTNQGNQEVRIVVDVGAGEFKVGDAIHVEKKSGDRLPAKIVDMGIFPGEKSSISNSDGPSIILLEGIETDDLEVGDLLVK